MNPFLKRMLLRPYELYAKLSLSRSLAEDKRRGVDFFAPYFNGSHRYRATPRMYDRAVKKILRQSDHAGDRILDVGCGKGRMLEELSAFGFLKVDGLDYDSHLVEIARKNMKTLGLPCEVFIGDATAFDGYDAYNYFYLCQPFPEDIMLRFIDKLKESLRRSPRAITIVYMNPVCEKNFADAGFRLCGGGGRYHFY